MIFWAIQKMHKNMVTFAWKCCFCNYVLEYESRKIYNFCFPSLPITGSLNKINEKLRQELHDLDGEIEYMKYVNKTHGNIQTNATTKSKGKKR